MHTQNCATRKLSKENEDLRKQVKALQKEKNFYYRYFVNDTKRINAEQEAFIKERQEAQHKISELEKELEYRDELIRHEELTIEERQSRIYQLEREKQDLINTLQDQMVNNENVAKLKSEMLQLSENLKHQAELFDQVNAAGMYLNRDYAILEGRCQDLMEELDRVSDENETLEEANTVLRVKLNRACNANEKFEEVNTVLRAELNRTCGDNGRLEEANTELRAELAKPRESQDDDMLLHKLARRITELTEQCEKFVREPTHRPYFVAKEDPKNQSCDNN